MLDQIIMVLPTMLAIISLILLNSKTRWLCYTLVSLSLLAELVAPALNITALAAVSTVMVALVASELMQRSRYIKANYAAN